MRPHRWQPTSLPHPWDSPGKNTGVGCHFLLQCMKVKSESEVALCDPMDCSLPGSSARGIFQARVLEWGAIAFSRDPDYYGGLRILEEAPLLWQPCLCFSTESNPTSQWQVANLILVQAFALKSQFVFLCRKKPLSPSSDMFHFPGIYLYTSIPPKHYRIDFRPSQYGKYGNKASHIIFLVFHAYGRYIYTIL